MPSSPHAVIITLPPNDVRAPPSALHDVAIRIGNSLPSTTVDPPSINQLCTFYAGQPSTLSGIAMRFTCDNDPVDGRVVTIQVRCAQPWAWPLLQGEGASQGLLAAVPCLGARRRHTCHATTALAPAFGRPAFLQEPRLRDRLCGSGGGLGGRDSRTLLPAPTAHPAPAPSVSAEQRMRLQLQPAAD